MKQLYLLVDGTYAEPSDCSKDKGGVLRNKNGLAVALYADGSPQEINKDAEVNMNVKAAKLGVEPGAPAPAVAPLMTTETIKAAAPEPPVNKVV